MFMVIAMHIVYGGSFNPPTKAHFEVYRYLKRKLPVEKFTFLPVGGAYDKESLRYDEHRFKMLKVMTEGYDDIHVSDIELTDTTFQGTYESLKRLRKNDERLAFVIGADNLPTLHRWKNIHKMLTDFEFVVLNRKDADLDRIINRDHFLKHYRERFIVFEDFDMPLSSSDYRKTQNDELITPRVLEYIKQHNLY